MRGRLPDEGGGLCPCQAMIANLFRTPFAAIDGGRSSRAPCSSASHTDRRPALGAGEAAHGDGCHRARYHPRSAMSTSSIRSWPRHHSGRPPDTGATGEASGTSSAQLVGGLGQRAHAEDRYAGHRGRLASRWFEHEQRTRQCRLPTSRSACRKLRFGRRCDSCRPRRVLVAAAVWRHACSSTPMTWTPSSRCGSSIRTRLPSARTASLAVFHDTPRDLRSPGPPSGAGTRPLPAPQAAARELGSGLSAWEVSWRHTCPQPVHR
ncbi:MAG: hypothetical protein JWO11_215 [Nocardioides sp.]|nr:hypothetical protein [Nocardioides sp.]